MVILHNKVKITFCYGILIFMLVILTVLTSCNKDTNKDTIQLWHYTESLGLQEIETQKIIEIAREYCDKNNLKLEVHSYTRETIDVSDYILKRNIASTMGNIIIIDNFENLISLSNQHADYTKIDGYDKLVDAYKGRFCIPLYIKVKFNGIENDFLKSFGIEAYKPLLTHIDYLNLKQKLRENGAMFEINVREFGEIIKYNLSLNGLVFLNIESEIYKNIDELKRMLKKSVLGTFNDILKYHKNLKIERKLMNSPYEDTLKDKNTGLLFSMSQTESMRFQNYIDPRIIYYNIMDVANKTFYIDDFVLSAAPNLFIGGKISNDKIYGLASHIISEETYMLREKHYNFTFPKYLPITKIDKTKEFLEVNDDLEFIGQFEEEIEIADESERKIKSKNITNSLLDIIYKNDEKSNEIADMNFYDFDFRSEFSFIIYTIISDIAQKLNGENLTIEGFNPNDLEINEIIDKRIEGFVKNFNILNN